MIGQAIERLTPPAALLGAALLICVVGGLDHATGVELSFSIFYLLPVALVAWRLGGLPGASTALVCATVWGTLDWLGGHVYSHPLLPFWNSGVRLGFYIVVVVALVRIRRGMEAERKLNRIDFLTGAANSRAFYEEAELEIVRCRRSSKPLTVAYFDCDNFKWVNDRLGHKTGDALLRNVAQTAIGSVRRTDLVARLGGDEFAVLLPGSDAAAAQEVVERLRGSLLERMERDGWPVTFSIGVATFSSQALSLEEMIHRADELMYRVKSNGKNRIEAQTFG